MQHNDSYNDASYSFVNNIITPEGGTHLSGFRSALTKTFNSYARDNKILKDSGCSFFRRRYQRRINCNYKYKNRRAPV